MVALKYSYIYSFDWCNVCIDSLINVRQLDQRSNHHYILELNELKYITGLDSSVTSISIVEIPAEMPFGM